jgi:2-dehydro-3-deoxyphosphogluconate aldolase/(4S)-4-hydroxy-2-oxoglutarate aldolase
MDARELSARLGAWGVVPVVSIDDAADAVPLATAVADGGLPVIEVTFRTAAAADAIAAIRRALPDVLVGAGTVLDAATVDRALLAGASFIVAPGLNPSVVERTTLHGIPMIPGAVTPTEIERALALGIELVKFFPAEAAGGAKYLRAVSAPYRAARFMPTGGVNPGNLADYLALPCVIACGGTWLAPAEAVRAGRWADIREAAAGAVAVAAPFTTGS